MALTAKLESFCQNSVDGFTDLESYRRSHNAIGMADNSCSTEAWKIKQRPAIALRIQQLRDQLAERLLFPRLERLEILKGIAKGGERDGDRINAIKTFSDFVGDGAPVKIEVEHSGTIDSVKTLADFYKDNEATGNS